MSEDGIRDTFEYDVCLSFAGEDREYVEQVAELLRSKGVRVFYDEYEQAMLWGKDLYAHLDYVYQRAARFCVLFASDAYARKVWTSHERKSAQSRAIGENREYILPARFDDTEVPGLRDTVGYIDLRSTDPPKLAELIVEKLGHRQVVAFLPPQLDRLHEVLDVGSAEDHLATTYHAHEFFGALKRTSEDEREVVLMFMLHGCDTQQPDNVHMSLDLLRRYTGMPASEIKNTLAAVRCLGFSCTIRESEAEGDPHELRPEDEMLVLKWEPVTEWQDGEPTLVAQEMVHVAVADRCDECGPAALRRLDFSSLASATHSEHLH